MTDPLDDVGDGDRNPRLSSPMIHTAIPRSDFRFHADQPSEAAVANASPIQLKRKMHESSCQQAIVFLSLQAFECLFFSSCSFLLFSFLGSCFFPLFLVTLSSSLSYLSYFLRLFITVRPSLFFAFLVFSFFFTLFLLHILLPPLALILSVYLYILLLTF